jgi:crossover junction endodeoxyribonuclease RusA
MHTSFSLPFPPSMNTYWRNFRGRTIISKNGREFREAVIKYVIDNNIPKFGDKKLKITLILRPRDKRKIDIDNRIKAVLDALEHAGVFDDDFQVDHIEMIRGENIKGGLLHVVIEEIKDPRQPEGESTKDS